MQEIMSALEVEIGIEMDKPNKGLGHCQMIEIAKDFSPDLVPE